MTEQELKSLISNKENENLEYKEARTTYSLIGEPGKLECIYAYCVGIGNSGGGHIILGINNDGIVVGSNAIPDVITAKEILFDKLGVVINIEIHIIDSKRIVVFHIPNRPVGTFFDFYKRPLYRIGQRLVDMPQDRQREILFEKKPDWSAQISVGATINDISDEAIIIAKDRMKKRYPNEDVSTWDKRKVLEKSKLLKFGNITNAAIILLGKPESRDFLQPSVAEITWILKDKDNNELDYEHFYPPFILAIDKVFAKIRNLKYRYITPPK